MISHPNLKRNIPQTKKQRLFRLFHILIIEYSISHYFYSALILIQMLQMIYFSIHNSCCDIWTFSGINIIQQIFGFLEGSLAWQLSSNIVLIIFNCIVLLAYGIAAVDITYQVANATPELRGAKDNFHQIRIKYLQYLSTLTRQVLQIPLISLTTISIKNSLKLSSTLQICLLIISILAFLLYILMSLLFIQLFIDNSPFSKFSLSWSINKNQKYKIVLKCVIAIVSSLLPSKCEPNSFIKIVHLTFLVIIMVGFLCLCFLNYLQPNLVHNSVRKVYQHSTVTLGSIYFMILVQKIVAPNQNITILYLLIFCFMFNFAWQLLKKYREQSLIFRIYKTLTTKNQILSYNYLMCQYIRDFYHDPLCLIKLQGILSDHIISCKKHIQVCKCRTIRDKLTKFYYSSDLLKVREQQQLWFQFVKQNLLYNTQKMNHLPQFHLLLSYIQKDQLNNNFLSYTNLQKCDKKNINFSIQFLIYHQKRIIQKTFISEDIRNNEKKQVDVNKFIAMSDQIQDFQKHILLSSLGHLEYWKKFGGTNKKTKSNIMKLGSKLLISAKDCQQAYKKINQKYPNNLQSIVLFSNYSKYILNNHELILKNKRVFNQIKKRIFRAIKILPDQQKQKYSENSLTGSIIISGQKHNVGTIKTCSSKITKILKYAPYQLVGQNINTLMPNFIGNMHNQVLCKYLDKSQPQSNFVQRYVPMIDKNNFMIFSRMMTKPLPSLINGLQIIGIFQKVRQNHIRHQNETPKYILYRCDTGNVQAISQSFYNNYGYRLMKVNQYSQISQQLVFKSIFQDIHDNDLIQGEQGLQCELKLKNQPKKTVRIKAYIKSQLYYFKIKIRLLSIFNCSSTNILLNNAITINITPSNLALSQKSQQVNGNNPTPKSFDEPSKQATQTLTQQQLKQLQKKTPLKLRLFKLILFIFLILMISISIVQFYSDYDKITVLKSFHEHNQYTSMSLLYLINVGYYIRMMHLSVNNSSDLLNFDLFKSNVSRYTNNLQKAEFWLVNKEVQYNKKIDFSFNTYGLSWQINQKSAIFSSSQSLSLSIFDLVTSSSSFESAKKNNFNFSLNLISDNISAKTNSYYRNIFRIRYSSLFQLISLKYQYSDQIVQAYLKKLDIYQIYSKIFVGIACSFIILSLFAKTRILYVILNSIYGITSLFNWLTPGEIQKQVQNCQNFLQHFFIYYYQVVLQLKKNQILRGYSFAEEKLQQNKNNRFMKTMTYQFQQNMNKNKSDGIDSQMQSDNMLLMQGQYLNDEIDLVKVSDKCLKNKQISKNKDQILMQQKTPLKEQIDQRQLDINQYQQGFCCENLNSFISIILGYLFLLAHFLAIFLSDQAYFIQAQAQISTQNFIYKNIQMLDMLKYYGLENALDKTKFQNYPQLSYYMDKYTIEIYKLQKQMNTFTNSKNYTPQTMKAVQNLNNNGICEENFTESLSYLPSSFNTNECRSIDNGILSQALRASIVGYIQNIKNITNIKDINQLVISESFIRILRLDKYIKSAMYSIINSSIDTAYKNLDNQNKIKITQFSFFSFFAIIVILLINWKVNKDINNRIQGTYQIISLIPQRIFHKNANICSQYRKNVKKLLQ